MPLDAAHFPLRDSFRVFALYFAFNRHLTFSFDAPTVRDAQPLPVHWPAIFASGTDFAALAGGLPMTSRAATAAAASDRQMRHGARLYNRSIFLLPRTIIPTTSKAIAGNKLSLTSFG